VNKAQVIGVLEVFPEIFLQGNPYGPKGYFLAGMYSWGIFAGVLPVILTVRKYILKRGN
jgi:hypothetical protein